MSFQSPYYRDSLGRVCACGCEAYMFWEEFSTNTAGYNGKASVSRKCKNKMYKERCGRDRTGELEIAEKDKVLPPPGSESADDFYKTLTE